MTRTDSSPLVTTGRTWLFGDNVDTDAIFPGSALASPIPEAARRVFEALRPGWVDEVRPGDVIVAGSNFGLGSSRPCALLFQELGVAAIVAESFNSLFERNCINMGLMVAECRGVVAMVEEGDLLTVDLGRACLSSRRTGETRPCSAYPQELKQILIGGGLEQLLRKEDLIS